MMSRYTYLLAVWCLLRVSLVRSLPYLYREFPACRSSRRFFQTEIHSGAYDNTTPRLWPNSFASQGEAVRVLHARQM